MRTLLRGFVNFAQADQWTPLLQLQIVSSHNQEKIKFEYSDQQDRFGIRFLEQSTF